MIFVNDDEIRDTLKILADETRALQKANVINISAFISNCCIYNSILKIAPTEKIEFLKSEHNKREETIFDKSLGDLVSIHKKISKQHVSFIRAVKVRIYQLIEE